MAQHFLLSSKVRDISIMEISKMTERKAFQTFCNLRWQNPEKFYCPRCGAIDNHYYIKTRKCWKCKNCDRFFSVTTNTIFADRKLPFKQLLLMMYLYCSSPKGISASLLSRQADVSYKTALVYAHKFREVLLRTMNLKPLSGEIHVDGGHFGGKPRSGQFRNKARPDEIRNKIILGKTQGAKRSRITKANFERRKRNRRIVMNVREVIPGTGAVRTIVFVARSENEAAARHIAQNYIKEGSLVRTDESSAYNSYSQKFIHETVEHSKEYSTIDGVSNNQAESYFSRLRRMEYGITHRMMAKYMADYSAEIAWREDTRRYTEKERLFNLLNKSLSSGLSRWWRGYWQGYHRENEITFGG